MFNFLKPLTDEAGFPSKPGSGQAARTQFMVLFNELKGAVNVLEVSPVLISPTATTPATADNSTKIATTAFVKRQVPTTAITPATSDNSTTIATTEFVKRQVSARRFVGTFTRAANLVGNQVITIGFAPKFVKLMAAHSADRTFRSDGSCDGVSQIVLGEFSAPNNVPFVITGNTVALHNGTSSFFGAVTLSTTDGFTIAWSNGAGTITAGNALIKVEAWG